MKRAPDTTACDSNHTAQIEILPIQTGTAAREHRRKRMFGISWIAAGSGSRQVSPGWWSQRDLNPCLSLERAPS